MVVPPPDAHLRAVFTAWRDLAHPSAGGSEVVVDRLITGLLERGHLATLVAGGPIGHRDYPVLPAGGTYGQYLRAPWIARRFKHWDLLVDVANGIPFFSPLWWAGPRLCFVHHVHGQQWDQYFPRPIARGGRFVEGRVVPALYANAHFAAVSPSTERALQAVGVDADRIHVVHNGIDERLLRESPTRSPEPHFVALGRLAPNKGVDRLLDAWASVHPVVGGRLVVLGDGPSRDALEARRAPGVEIRGRVTEDEKIDLLGAAWLLIHGAHHEGWGLAIMEAAGLGTPALAYRTDGVRDSVVDGETGVLVDDEQGLVDAWVRLAGDGARRAELGAAARRRAVRYTWDRTVEEFLVAARATIGSRGR